MNGEFLKNSLKSCGSDVYIDSFIRIKRPELVSIGNHVAIDHGFYCTTSLEIGDYIHIAPYVSVIGGRDAFLKMDHFSTIAAGCRIICGSDEHLGAGLVGPTIPKIYQDRLIIKPIVFEKYANIGSNVIVFPGVILKEGSVVAAGSIVTKNTEPWMIHMGSPARPYKRRPKTKIITYAEELGYNILEK